MEVLMDHEKLDIEYVSGNLDRSWRTKCQACNRSSNKT